jgi:hypothetical protein
MRNSHLCDESDSYGNGSLRDDGLALALSVYYVSFDGSVSYFVAYYFIVLVDSSNSLISHFQKEFNFSTILLS